MLNFISMMRPSTINNIYGQDHILGDGQPLRMMVDSKKLSSTILWGPTGSGKTSIVRAIAKDTNAIFRPLNATENNVNDFRNILNNVEEGDDVLVFLDEIGRWNKSQLDVLLPSVEDGRIILFGATTENPKFAVNGTVLSRCLVYETKPLDNKAMVRVYKDACSLLNNNGISITADTVALTKLIVRCGGDARKFIIAIDTIVNLLKGDYNISSEVVDSVLPHKHMVFDKHGNEHFDLAHCYQESIQNSDCDSAIYWLAKWISSGEDPAYICRRMMITAFEDCASDPIAGVVAMAAHYAVERTGLPEAMIPMSLATCLMAKAKRDKSAYFAIKNAMSDVEKGDNVVVPEAMRAINSHEGNGQYIGVARRYVYD